MPKISRAKLLAATTTVVVLVLACNLELLPLALLVDTVGVDVLALLLGAQLVAVLPWVRAQGAAALRMGSRLLPWRAEYSDEAAIAEERQRALGSTQVRGDRAPNTVDAPCVDSSSSLPCCSFLAVAQARRTGSRKD